MLMPPTPQSERCPMTIFPRRRLVGPILLAILYLLPVGEARCALVRPYPGYGNFPITVDVAYRWHDGGTLDLEIMIEVCSGHLMYVREVTDLPFQSDLDVTVRLEGSDGVAQEIQEHVVLREMTLEDAVSRERVNNITLALENVTLPSGELDVRVVDRHQERRGARDFREHPRAFSEMHCFWVRPRPPSEFDGFSLGDPLFLRDYEDVDLFGRRILRDIDDHHAVLLEHLHLGRIYGLRQRQLQFACEVYPPDSNRADILSHDGLLVQAVSRELRFAMRDTLRFHDEQKTRLGLGLPVVVFHEIDVELLPPGTYLLSCASLDGKGRPWVAEFDVVWSLGVPRRRGDEEMAIARLLLASDELDEFRGADPVRRIEMLDAFWAPLDPVEETSQNEAWIEFQERISYVRQHLGGFGTEGEMDPRAEVYLRLGTPSRIVFEEVASNESLRTGPGRENWTDFRGFVDPRQELSALSAGDVPSSVQLAEAGNSFDALNQDYGIAGNSELNKGPTTGRFPNSRTDPLIGSSLHRLARHSRGNTFEKEPVSETWLYDQGGFPLFEHAWSDDRPRGFQFVFAPEKSAYELRYVLRSEAESD